MRKVGKERKRMGLTNLVISQLLRRFQNKLVQKEGDLQI